MCVSYTQQQPFSIIFSRFYTEFYVTEYRLPPDTELETTPLGLSLKGEIGGLYNPTVNLKPLCLKKYKIIHL